MLTTATKRRVVVTGLGLLTPLGLGVKENWTNLLEGKSCSVSLESDGNLVKRLINTLFKLVQEENLFIKGGIMATLSHPKLEADDCIAISVKYVLEKYPTSKIYIITSDKDYLQLAEERIEIYRTSFQDWIIER